MAASTTTNCRMMDSDIGRLPRPKSAPSSLLELRADQVLKRKDLFPFLLGKELALLDHDVVQRLARLVAFARDLRALLVAERGLEHGHDAERVKNHVARALG